MILEEGDGMEAVVNGAGTDTKMRVIVECEVVSSEIEGYCAEIGVI